MEIKSEMKIACFMAEGLCTIETNRGESARGTSILVLIYSTGWIDFVVNLKFIGKFDAVSKSSHPRRNIKKIFYTFMCIIYDACANFHSNECTFAWKSFDIWFSLMTIYYMKIVRFPFLFTAKYAQRHPEI